MKAILISDHAKWCALMMNGKKKIEVRKGTALYKAIQKLIDEYGYADIYVYCTKDKDLLVIGDSPFKEEKEYCVAKDNIALNGDKLPILNGKVVFKFRCYKVEEINKYPSYYKISGFYYTPSLSWDKLEEVSCLSFDEINEYLKAKTSYAVHISDLEIFDKPKELSEFRPSYQGKCLTSKCKYCDECGYCDVECKDERLTKAPQSFCYVKVE